MTPLAWLAALQYWPRITHLARAGIPAAQGLLTRPMPVQAHLADAAALALIRPGTCWAG
jgi:hypothetical protein